MIIKKLLIQTNLENVSDLVHYFSSIQEINEQYFNEINIYADQVPALLFRLMKLRNTLLTPKSTKRIGRLTFAMTNHS